MSSPKITAWKDPGVLLKQQDPFNGRVSLHRVSHKDGGHHLEYNGHEVMRIHEPSGSGRVHFDLGNGEFISLPLACDEEYDWMQEAMRPEARK